MSKFKEFARNVRKIATSEIVIEQLESLEDEQTKLQNRLEEAEKALRFYTELSPYCFHKDDHGKTAREYFDKYSKESEK